MKLPNRKSVHIPTSKLEGYLLSITHTFGKSKAKYFRINGFNETNLEIFKRELENISLNNEIKERFSTSYGEKFIIDGIINTPKGGNIMVRTVWIIENGEKNPRFVTAYPA